ncbi:MAG: DUF2339 domain-containing protein [Bacteroidetes bacterium]|nr:DUF2339 domain-containing protein [Bacteroidota bacterium]
MEKLSGLMKRQESFQRELEDLRKEINRIQSLESQPETGPANPDIQEVKPEEMISALTEPILVKEEPVTRPQEPGLWKDTVESVAPKGKQSPYMRANIEKFIGENLINKIGIVILVIGVGIGAKYAIDHDMISPWTRIILGYVLGLGLFGFAFWLKKEYENFSAVLLSGSMAIMYFITFAAYSFYSLIPLTLTFSLMVFFTVFTVIAAIGYNRQVIAHIGLVGAYAVPFLLSDGSGKVVILFSYMAIINAGILAIAFRKYWKPLYYSSFLLTWLIFLTWFIPKYEDGGHFGLAWTFISIFFVTFYFIFLAYKLLKKEKFRIEDILLLLANSSVFYGLGYALLYHHPGGRDYFGLFTLGNGLIHFFVSILIYRQKQPDRNLFYFTAGLVIAFLTISIPVQLDGNWVTMLWSAEAAVLFWIGRTKSSALYELLSYPLMVLAFFCIATHWPELYHTLRELPEGAKIIPIFNINFLTSLLFIASFGFIAILNGKNKFESPLSGQKTLIKAFDILMPGMLLIVIYFAFYMEITAFWNQQYADALVNVDKGPTGMQQYTNDNIPHYKTISILLYSLLFLSVLSFVNILKLKKSLLGLINLGFNMAAVGLFLTAGLIALGTLRESYLGQELSEYFYRGFMLVGIRYVCFGFLAMMLFAVYRYVQEDFLGTGLKIEFDFFLHITVLTVISNELINWMDLSGSVQSYKLGLSILFGVYSLLLIVLGIWKKKLHLRIGAIVLFSLTLLKLFFYDLSSLDTIAKTIVFVVLGVLLLIISFLYTKYKQVIFEDHKDE